MTHSPILWGIGLACALGGAIAGNAVGSIPVNDRSTIGMFYQSHQAGMGSGNGSRPVPDHYPLVTREGVVDVAQLSDRGLFSQARYRTSELAAAFADTENDDPGAGLENADAPPVDTATTAEAPASHPAEIDTGPGSTQGSSQAKIIDVQATLAMR